ncbi:MAG: hypothetical protein IKN53_01220 [Oscillibacter sp.]|nr:hypothetical protein [Oscillibacter sp.]
MKKLSAALERFAYRHPRFGIPNLMRYIVFGNAIVYVLSCLAGADKVAFLAFNWGMICRGEVWRLFTFILMPGYGSPREIVFLLLFLYLYYMIGTTLEREWGTAKFNLYYFLGAALTALTGVIMGLLFGGAYISGAGYVNLSLFFAFAMLYPDMQFLLFFFIPVKVKWLAWVDAAFFALSIGQNLLAGYWVGALLPLVAILNFFLFFWTEITDFLRYRRDRARRQTSAKTVQFRAAAREQHKREEARGYRRKCEVCGRTDTDYPDLEFRYCSRCAGYHCFCIDHIFDHQHFTQ